MNVLIFGATGMVGQGVLRECLRDPGVARVLAVGRRTTGQAHTPPARKNPTPCLKCRFGGGWFDYIMAGVMAAGNIARTTERSDA